MEPISKWIRSILFLLVLCVAPVIAQAQPSNDLDGVTPQEKENDVKAHLACYQNLHYPD